MLKRYINVNIIKVYLSIIIFYNVPVIIRGFNCEFTIP